MSALDRAMSALETLSEIWAAQINLPDAVQKIQHSERHVVQFVKQAYMEGAYAGRMSQNDELAALRAQTQWRPIETAPKDGTLVFISWGEDGDAKSSRFSQDVQRWCAIYEDDDFGCDDPFIGEPLYYMHIPKLPTTAMQAKEQG